MKRCPICAGICLPTQAFCPACGSPLKADALVDGDPYIGTVFAGKYRIDERIGEGGMAVVYRAKTLDVGRSVAIKVLHSRYSGDKAATTRFEREARVASGLNHPNCISILDFGHTPSGISYIVMEYLEGQSLARLLDAGSFTLPRTVHIILQILSCLETAHAQGVVHRDLKPGNVFILSGTDDFVKVLDFGIARVRRPGLERLTRTGMVCGTPEYMSPEQARGQDIDARSDLYAAGIMFYEMLTGSRPFDGSTAAEIMGAQIHTAPTPPSKKNKARNIPPSLDAIVVWALSKQPEERFPSAREFRRVLEEWMEVAGKTLEQPDEEPDSPLRRAVSGGMGAAGIRETRPDKSTFDSIFRLPAKNLESLASRLPSDALQRVVPKGAAPFMGLATRMSYLEHAASGDGFRVFRFEGPAGIGKSRTAEELMSRLAAEGRRPVKVTPDPSDVTESLAAIQRLATQLLGLPCEPVSADDLATPLQKVGCAGHDAGFCELFALGPTTAGNEPVADRRLKRAEAWRQLVTQAARRQPLVMLVEGMDRLDGASRELILALAAMDTDAPFTLILTHGEGFFALWPEQCEHVELEGLEPEAAKNLARRFSRGRLSDAQIRSAVDRAGGNPLCLRELLAYMVSFSDREPPAQLADMIAQRVLRLVPEVLFCLQNAAVLSDMLDPSILSDLVQAQGYAFTPAEVRYLLEVLGSAGYLTLGPAGWVFTHRLYRQVVYAGIPAMIKAGMHRHAAFLLSKQGGSDALLAHHFWEAEEPAHALPHLVSAAGRALDLLDEETAEMYYRRALEGVKGPDSTLTEAHGRAWVEAVCGLVKTKRQSGQDDEADSLLDAARRRLTRVGWEKALDRIEKIVGGGTEAGDSSTG